MPEDVRQSMEESFGEELSDVRVHADEEAAKSVEELGANAYTSDREVYFAHGKYAPQTPDGKRLLAHELTHVIQQSKAAQGESSGALVSSPETEATCAADRIATGGKLDFAVSPVQGGEPALSPADWTKDVADAKKMNDTDAMAKLVETALTTTKIKVVVAKTGPAGNIDPKNYQPLPDINFDVNLNSKKSKPLSSDPKAAAATRSLAANYGYSFSDSGKKYVILGPEALDAASPIFTRMFYEHEIYHTTHHLDAPATKSPSSVPTDTAPSTPTPAPAPAAVKYKDDELETYTRDFINYFHQLYRLGPQWVPLIKFYEESSTAAQKNALALLKSYYTAPPSPPIAAADVAAIKKAFEGWLRRRLNDSASKKLIQDLSSELGISLSAPDAGSAPTTTPTSTPTAPP